LFPNNNNRELFQDSILSFFRAHRQMKVDEVKMPTTEKDFKVQMYKNQDFSSMFKQYLVNKKVYEAFDQMDSKNQQSDQPSETNRFFQKLTESLRDMFDDQKLELDFQKENFEFFLNLSDGQKITFNQLADGFSAYSNILLELFIKTDMIRKEKKDYSFEPCGFVLIDEPENHLHLKMQYKILPLLARLFPKLQMIVATHSPAVISSLKNAVVYDLSTQDIADEDRVGSSYSELMLSHFGLENEFSDIADEIIQKVQSAVDQKNTVELRKILEENKKYMTSVLLLEIESQIRQIQKEASV
jgi:predicted ATP-binding protein involved in virulence